MNERKKKMKKKISAMIISSLLAVVCAVSFTACGSSGEATTAAETTAEAASTDDSASTGGVLKMVTEATFPPYEYYDGDAIVGIDVEIAQAIAAELGMELEVQDIAFDSIITSVQSGKADIGLAGMTVTEDRKESVDFSNSYAHATQAVIVKEGSDITSVDDLEGKTVAVQTGTTGDIYASDIKDVDLKQFTKATDAVLSVVNGQADAMIIDNAPAEAYVAANEGLKILDESFADEDYAIAVKKGNTELLDKINAALENLEKSGELQKIVDKYITTDK